MMMMFMMIESVSTFQWVIPAALPAIINNNNNSPPTTTNENVIP
jgi:hypothetical protein